MTSTLDRVDDLRLIYPYRIEQAVMMLNGFGNVHLLTGLLNAFGLAR